MNRLALGILALGLSACSWGPFTAETTNDSSQHLWSFRTESAVFGVALLINEDKVCWAGHIEDNDSYGCIER